MVLIASDNRAWLVDGASAPLHLSYIYLAPFDWFLIKKPRDPGMVVHTYWEACSFEDTGGLENWSSMSRTVTESLSCNSQPLESELRSYYIHRQATLASHRLFDEDNK